MNMCSLKSVWYRNTTNICSICNSSTLKTLQMAALLMMNMTLPMRMILFHIYLVPNEQMMAQGRVE